jgi:copper homeostasis protein
MQKACYNYLLEIACFNIESCLQAEQAGADRIEFCAKYSVGGVTPTHNDILKAKKLLQIPVHVIIRPRGGNFVYTKKEIETIKNDILFCKQNGINGVVFGALTAVNKIDKKLNKELVELAGSMSTTFHRAIDECENIEEAMNDLVELGFTRVLTSGGEQNAIEGIDTLKTLQEEFGKQITIIPGGGIRSSNINKFIDETKCYEFHSAAITNNTDLVDVNEVKQLLEKIKQL